VSLIISNLTKKYGQTLAVDAISFEAKPGQVLGFLGPNGAGKSTTMKVATGYLKQTAGKVLVMGKEVSTDSQETKALIGYLPEHNPLYLDMYVPEYLTFSGKCYGMGGQELAKKVTEAIDRTGLTSERRKKIGALSKGYRQRVGLAQTLVHNPPVLILDEPTTGLDPNQIQEIRKLIREIGQEKTVVLSTHIMQEVEAICGRYVIINKGKIVADGNVGAGEDNVFKLELDKQVGVPALLELGGVASVKYMGDNAYLLSLDDERQGRSSILRYCADQNLDLKSLSRQAQSLEDIFRTATGQ
jgi:ABC-2 type transport system ATP-binding protein